MYGGQTFLAVIPARGGSKGIPGKNLHPLAGRPLIEYTLDAALGSRHLDTICVTSDDQAILAIARSAGITAVERPPHLASDTARSIDAVLHAIGAIGVAHDAMVLLQPTSPLRIADHVDGAIELYLSTGQPVAGVSPARESPVLVRTLSANSVLAPLLPGTSTVRRQDMPTYWHVNGAIYVNAIATLTAATSLNDNPVGYPMAAPAGLDIDERADLALAEWHLGRARARARAAITH